MTGPRQILRQIDRLAESSGDGGGFALSPSARYEKLLSRVGARALRAAVGLVVIGVVTLTGCSSSGSPKPQVVSIAVTDPNGIPLKSPLTSLIVNTTAYLDVSLVNDSSGLGADWTVACGSAPATGTPLPPGQTVSTACGTFTPVHTLSAPVPNYVSNGSGYVTLYTAPAVPPQGGIVTLYAASVADPSRYASLAFPILGLPISIGFAPQPPASISAGETVSLKAVVNNDYTPKGVTWSVVCGSSACGSYGSNTTASGVATAYTAPAVVPTGGTVTLFATSVTDPTKSVSATITIATDPGNAPAINGVVRGGIVPMVGSSIELYVAGETGYGSAARLLKAKAATTTDGDGRFTLSAEEACPRAASEIYLVARGGGSNRGLDLMTALGSCDQVAAKGDVVLNEVTTLAAAYALRGFMRDGSHIGSTPANLPGMVNAFETAQDLVDISTGEARKATRTGEATVPQAEINSLANLLHTCIAGDEGRDAGWCGNFLGPQSATRSGDQPGIVDTISAALRMAHGAARPDVSGEMSSHVDGEGPFQPSLLAPPEDWLIRLSYFSPKTDAEMPMCIEGEPLTRQGRVATTLDSSGNAWLSNSAGAPVIEIVSAANPKGDPQP